MSLFGTSPDGAAPGLKSSLFDDDEHKKGAAGGGGLFESDDGGRDDKSPWGFVTPRKQQARGNLVKNLLAPNEVPESYIDAWDAVLASEYSSGLTSVSTEGVRKLLTGAGLPPPQQASILALVAPGAATSIGRGEFCVLLALIGLAQEGEEASLDSVDDRRKRLPEATLPAIPRSRPAAAPPAPAANYATPAQAQPAAAPSFSYTDSDPWGSPATMRHAMANGQDPTTSHASAVERTTSAYSSSGAGNADDAARLSGSTASGIGGDAWSAYNNNGNGSESFTGAGFSGAGAGFGDSAGGAGGGNDPPRAPVRIAKPSRQVSHGAQEVLTVVALPDKEGVFLFQHRNYEIASSRKNTKVVRRYSDFAWLLDCLHKKYPFRQLPLLPPKRVAINGNHLAADNGFIEKRRKGLARFVNALIRHPVLKEEQLVTMFLTVPTELAAWRKQAAISVLEEFTNRPLPPGLEDSLPATLEDLITTVRQGVRRSAEHYIGLCNLVERLIKRRDGLAVEYSRMAMSLSALTEASADTYRFDNDDVPLLNAGLQASAKHATQHQSLLEQENASWDANALEDLKAHRDALVAMRDMFDRKERLSKDNIPSLEKRIATNEAKLTAVRAKPDAQRKAGDAEKLEEAIVKDKQSIVDQHNRGIFIRECVRDEIANFQSTTLHVGRSFQDWSAERAEFAEHALGNWRAWAEEVESMPSRE